MELACHADYGGSVRLFSEPLADFMGPVAINYPLQVVTVLISANCLGNESRTVGPEADKNST